MHATRPVIFLLLAALCRPADPAGAFEAVRCLAPTSRNIEPEALRLSPAVSRSGDHWEVWKQNRSHRFSDLWDLLRSSFHELESLAGERHFCREAVRCARETAFRAGDSGDFSEWKETAGILAENMGKKPDRRWARDKRAVWEALVAFRDGKIRPSADRIRMLEEQLREYEHRLDRMIGAIRRGRHSEALEQTAKLAGQLLFRIGRIRSLVQANRFGAARSNVLGLSRLKIIKGEPLYIEIPGLCHAVHGALSRGDVEHALDWIEVLAQYVEFARRWPRILDRFTEFWLESSVPEGKEDNVQERIGLFFDQVASGFPGFSGLKHVRDRARLWALLTQWFRISRRRENGVDPNPVFHAASVYRRILNYPESSRLFSAPWFGKNRYRSAWKYLESLGGRPLLREDLPGLAGALALDFRLDPQGTGLLLECVRIEPREDGVDHAASALKTSLRAA